MGWGKRGRILGWAELPITHENVVSLRLMGNKLVVTTWSEHSDPWMPVMQGSLHPNTYVFEGRVSLRRVSTSPREIMDSEELRRRIAAGETVSVVLGGRRPRVEVEYEYRSGSFHLDIDVRWA